MSLEQFIVYLLTYLRKTLENKIITVPDIASSIKPLAHKTPIDAVHHNVAAVVNPLIFTPSFNITPAPKKPIPVTIWAAILVTSMLYPFNKTEKLTNKYDPIATRIVVLRPTERCLYCLSIPIKKLRKKHINK